MTNNLLTKVISTAGLDWFELAGKFWKYGRKLLRGMASEGMYEVLEYESTLELHDPEGKRATFNKRMKIRYLQDEIIAFPDFGWGDGKVLRNYKTNIGTPVDQYKAGYKTFVLISLRQVKNKGDIDEFNISWDIHKGFLKPDGYWETSITHRMKSARVNVIFPKRKAPKRIFLEESNERRTTLLGCEYWQEMSDGRWLVQWEKKKPRLYEQYILRWVY